MWGCTGCFQKLDARDANGQTKDKTGQDRREGGRQKEVEKAGRKQPLCTQEGKTAGQERRKEGGRKKEKGADEAGITSTERYCIYTF